MATMTVDKAGGILSVDISVGAVQKTFWSVSKRLPQPSGGYGEWITIAIFDDKSGGTVNQRVSIGDCQELIGTQIAVVFCVIRVNNNQADPYSIKANFSCQNGAPITGRQQSEAGSLNVPSVIEQFDFEVAA